MNHSKVNWIGYLP